MNDKINHQTLSAAVTDMLLKIEPGHNEVYPVGNCNHDSLVTTVGAMRRKLEAADKGTWVTKFIGDPDCRMLMIARVK